MRSALSMHLIRRCAVLALLLALAGQGGCKAESQQWQLWEQYCNRFVDGQGRVLDRNQQDHTTSEGEAYGMFFALIANDRPRFQKFVDWTEANLAQGDLTLWLPAWNWGKAPDGQYRVIDANPAADADLWMAYSLIEAGRLWHSDRYQKLGTVMASRIAHEEVVLIPGLGTTLLPGPQGFHPDTNTYLLNPSYLPLPILTAFAHEMPQGPWGAILDSLQQMLSQGSGDGYAMDWVVAGQGIHPSPSPMQVASGKPGLPAVGSFDAIRVYLWLGLADPGTPGLRALIQQVPSMAVYMKSQVTPPLQVDSTGKILSPDAPVGFSAAIVPYLVQVGMKQQAKSQLDRLNATRDDATGLFGHASEYYDQNLALFSTGWVEQRYRFDRDGKLKVKWK